LIVTEFVNRASLLSWLLTDSDDAEILSIYRGQGTVLEFNPYNHVGRCIRL